MTKLFNVSIKKSLIDGYNRHAVYFSSSRSRAWVEIDQTVKSLPKNAKVLDLGCGNGRLLLSLPKDCQYFGVDFSNDLIEEAKKLHPHKRFLVADMCDESFWDDQGQFDAIYMVASIHHVEGKYHRVVFEQCYSHLKEDGLIVVTTWNLLQPRMWGYHINSIWGKITNGIRAVWVSFRDDFSRYHWTFDRAYLSTLAKDAGFVVVRCEYVTKGVNRKWFNGENLILMAKKSSLSADIGS